MPPQPKTSRPSSPSFLDQFIRRTPNRCLGETVQAKLLELIDRLELQPLNGIQLERATHARILPVGYANRVLQIPVKEIRTHMATLNRRGILSCVEVVARGRHRGDPSEIPAFIITEPDEQFRIYSSEISADIIGAHRQAFDPNETTRRPNRSRPERRRHKAHYEESAA